MTRWTNLTVDLWMKDFVGKLLEMKHSQWIFECITKHHKTKDTKVLSSQQEVLRSIERQLNIGIASVLPENQWMLESNSTKLQSKLLSQQQYWLWAVEATRQVGTRAEELTEGKSSSWKNIIKDGKFDHLPRCTPRLTEEATKKKHAKVYQGR